MTAIESERVEGWIEGMLGKLEAEGISFDDQTACFSCFDNCCGPNILKFAYKLELERRK